MSRRNVRSPDSSCSDEGCSKSATYTTSRPLSLVPGSHLGRDQSALRNSLGIDAAMLRGAGMCGKRLGSNLGVGVGRIVRIHTGVNVVTWSAALQGSGIGSA